LLTRLYIQNIALIDRLEIDLYPGFTVLTGETGAGKSIIIDAVGVAIGEQGLTEFIRSGEDKALVEAAFEVGSNKKVLDVLEQSGFLPEPGEQLILTRELVLSGKNICRVNGRQVNLSVFREIARNLVDIYGQHHQQSLLDPQKHIELLDEYGGDTLVSLKQQVNSLYEETAHLQSKIKSTASNAKEQARMADVFKYELAEIEKCQLAPGEDSKFEEEKKILANAEKLYFLSNTAYELLYEGGKQKPIIDMLSEAVNSLKEIRSIDESIAPVCEMMESSLYQLEEAARDIKAYIGRIEADPDRLEEVENRLNLIRQLKRKYGDSIREILAYKDQIASSLELLTNFEDETTKTSETLVKVKSEYNETAGRLSAARKKAAAALKNQITGELKDLNMPHVTFEVRLSPRIVPTAQGIDDVEFLISPNKGEPLKPLAKIVSGGEVSRIMLAFKTILAKIDSISTLIFDEVDTGIGGGSLHAVAQKMFLIGRDRQVICVTHSPQIAGCGDNHLAIMKLVNNGRTLTRVKELSMPERVDEIARMLAGGKVSPATKKLAQEILKQQELF